jgi:hypothetical protein
MNDGYIFYHFKQSDLPLRMIHLIWIRDNLKDSQFGKVDGITIGIYCLPEDVLALKLKFGL